MRLNSLTTELYGPDQRVSRMLQDRGMSQKEISILRRRLPQFSVSASKAILDCVYRLYPEDPRADRFVVILRDRYGLDGEPIKTLQQIGEDLSISRERVRQLQVKLVGKLRRGPSRKVIEDALYAAARQQIRKAVMEHRAAHTA